MVGGGSYICQSTDVLTPEFESLFRDAVLPAVVEVKLSFSDKN